MPIDREAEIRRRLRKLPGGLLCGQLLCAYNDWIWQCLGDDGIRLWREWSATRDAAAAVRALRAWNTSARAWALADSAIAVARRGAGHRQAT